MSLKYSHIKNQAISLRQAGKSYGQIKRELGIKSKGTLSTWFKNITLSPEAKKRLEKYSQLAHDRGLFTFNKNRSERIKSENEESYKTGKAWSHIITLHELLIIGIVLYWTEGTKSERNSNRRISFSNSDPMIIKAFLVFVRKILKTPEEKIRAAIHLYPNIDDDSAQAYWAKQTKLPKDRFYIVRQISRASKHKRPINFLPYGTAVIRINDRKLFYRMKGLMAGLGESIIESFAFSKK